MTGQNKAGQKNILLTGGALIVLALSLSACTSVKKEMGIGRNSPDEFLVIKRAPLTVPPDYALRPPGIPSEAQPAADTAKTAKETVMGKSETPAVKGDPENKLLDKMGAAAANPDIRKQIDEDNGYIALKNRTVADKLIFWDDEQLSSDNTPASVVDPKAEAARLKKNKEEGKPVTEGAVPVIEKKKGTLDKIF